MKVCSSLLLHCLRLTLVPWIGPSIKDSDNRISCNTLSQDGTKTRLLEKLEGLFSPEATSLLLNVEYGAKRFQKQQKEAVTEVLTK